MAVAPACAQTAAVAPSTKPLEYDAVSIKPNNSGSGSVRQSTNNDRLTDTNVSLEMLLEAAYGVNEDAISGIDGPLKTARFDIAAKISDFDADAIKDVPEAERAAMLQSLLAEYFHLKVHTETRTLSVYEMVAMPGGIKFKVSIPGGSSGHMGIHNTQMTAIGIPLTSLTRSLSTMLHRTVIDKTGLTGLYDFTLNWSRDDGSEPDSQWPSIFTALQEQLGLKLESAKGPVETLVIDHVEMPSAN